MRYAISCVVNFTTFCNRTSEMYYAKQNHNLPIFKHLDAL
jgi:hypothetical protein